MNFFSGAQFHCLVKFGIRSETEEHVSEKNLLWLNSSIFTPELCPYIALLACSNRELCSHSLSPAHKLTFLHSLTHIFSFLHSLTHTFSFLHSLTHTFSFLHALTLSHAHESTLTDMHAHTSSLSLPNSPRKTPKLWVDSKREKNGVSDAWVRDRVWVRVCASASERVWVSRDEGERGESEWQQLQ